jgi:hypothetical protein
MDINAAVGGKAGLSQETIEAALGILLHTGGYELVEMLCMSDHRRSGHAANQNDLR